MEKQQATVVGVEPFGVFLSNEGFIHISSISKCLGRRVSSKEELESILPFGTNVDVVLREVVKDTRDKVHQIHYLLVGINTDQQSAN